MIKYLLTAQKRKIHYALIYSTIVLYSPIPTTYFLPHQKTLIRTKDISTLTLKATRIITRLSRKLEAELRHLHVHVHPVALRNQSRNCPHQDRMCHEIFKVYFLPSISPTCFLFRNFNFCSSQSTHQTPIFPFYPIKKFQSQLKLWPFKKLFTKGQKTQTNRKPEIII